MTREVFGKEHLNPSWRGVVKSVPTAAGKEEDDWDFGKMQSSSSFACERRRIVLFVIKGFISRAGLPASDLEWHSLSLAQCGLPDCLTLIELCTLLERRRDEAKSKRAEVIPLEERVSAAEKAWMRLVWLVGMSRS